jgi:type 1 glutamine amidotransferase
VAPTFVAITAESGDGAAQYADASAAAGVASDATRGAAKPVEFKWGAGVRVLMTGGGASHDYPRWFDQADRATLTENGNVSANYSDDMDAIAGAIQDADVLYLSHNKPTPNPATRQGILGHAASGKGVLLIHAGLWYNWADWPEYNRDLCGGGSRGHDRLGEFEVKVTNTRHPVTADLPADFKITDELYWFKPDPSGPPIEVLATAYSAQKKETYPMIFLVKHPKARVVGITLGHDGKAHEHPAYKKLLRNALAWAAAKAK